jgi:hypothetical protein
VLDEALAMNSDILGELRILSSADFVPGVDFGQVRSLVTMEQVLSLLGFEPSGRSGIAMVRMLSAARRRLRPSSALVLGERGDGTLLLPSLWESR